MDFEVLDLLIKTMEMFIEILEVLICKLVQTNDKCIEYSKSVQPVHDRHSGLVGHGHCCNNASTRKMASILYSSIC